MRDIRCDLEERAKLIDAQINSAFAHFEKVLAQVQGERDARVAELKSDLETVRKLMELEHRRIGNAPVPLRPPATSLVDFLAHKLSEFGALSSAELRQIAAKEGLLSESETASREVGAALATGVREERIRQLPDGRFAPLTPLTMSQAIGLTRAG
jgi:hypothetical protein